MGLFSKMFANGAKNFISPMTGKVVSMENVPDPAFAQKMMGEGCGIDLTDGTVIAPFDAEITAAYPTGHAFGLKSKEDGTEILIHVGIDTVDLEGEGFDTNIKKGDSVKQGDVLVVVDLDMVRQAGKSLVSPIAFTGNEKVEVYKIGQNITAGEKGLLNYE
ncbi:MAG TPA: PTS glucose transporter subunit IIA [Candidatus Megamonas gallistercoris]|nr:PTS glucose transporter subunit IIA [Candidatus Megamonas gallistercoris]